LEALKRLEKMEEFSPPSRNQFIFPAKGPAWDSHFFWNIIG
jgi:hypothetical protein